MFRFVFLAACLALIQASTFPVPSLDGRIVGGTAIPISEAPWSASLLLTGSNLFHTCGGSIISPTVILTAAHCLVGKRPVDLTIRVGSALNNAGGQLIIPSQIIVHEAYNPIIVTNDIGLIILEEEITIETASSITLPAQDETVEDGALAINSGWGRLIESGSSPVALQAVEIFIVNQEVCRQKNSFINNVAPTMICAGVDEGGKGSCNGDSGGPLMVDGTQVGLTSWSNGCVRPNFPTVYTRVASFIDWIEQTLAGIEQAIKPSN